MSMLHCQAGSVTDRVFLQKLQTMDLIMNRELTGQSIGSRRSKTEGSSVEWKDYTEYSAGDDLRRVDWNLYARFGKLYTRHFIGQVQGKNGIYLDASASIDLADHGRKSLMAMRCAAAMAYLSVRKNDRVEVALLRGTRAERLCEPVSGVNAFYQLMKLMDDIDFAGDTDIPAAISDDPQPGAADGMTVIVSDFLTGSDWKRAIDHLLSRGRIVSLIQVLAPQERDPAYGGRLALMDAEADDPLQSRMHQIVDRYSMKAYYQALAAWQRELRDFCSARGVGLLTMFSDEELDETFLKNGAAAGVIR